jgi:hypothetical protein
MFLYRYRLYRYRRRLVKASDLPTRALGLYPSVGVTPVITEGYYALPLS